VVFIFIYLLFSVNIKPPRHRFGFSLAWDWQLEDFEIISNVSQRKEVGGRPAIIVNKKKI
jgi:hypothetical protein